MNKRIEAYIQQAREEQPSFSKPELYHYALILACSDIEGLEMQLEVLYGNRPST